MFFTTLGGNGQIPMLIRLHDDYMISMISIDIIDISYHSSPAPDVQSGMNRVEARDFSVQKLKN